MKRVVVFRSNHIDPDPRVEKLAHALAKVYAVHVVGWDRTQALPAAQKRPDFTLELFSYKSSFGSGLKNLFHLLRWQLFLLGWVIRFGRDYEVYHACDFDTILPALFGRLIYGRKVVYDIFDFYADHIRSTPEWIKRIIRWLDHQAVQRADVLILVTEAQLRQLANVKPRRLFIIYNTPYDIPDLQLLPLDPAVKLRVAYIGILQVERSLFEMIEVMRRQPAWHFDLAGFGGDESLIVSRAQELPNISWHGRTPYPKTLSINRSADVMFSICNPQVPNYRHASANKVFESMMLGKPIIVAHDTNMDLMIEKYQCGLVVTYGNVDELEAALQRLADDPTLRRQLGQNGRKAYDEFYSWEEMERRLHELYASLVPVT
jgi:glycosyltransferase involved in cell wall biosynthesis